MSLRHNFQMYFLILIITITLSTFLVLSSSKDIYAKDEFSKSSNQPYLQRDNQNLNNNNDHNNNIPNQYIIYLKEDEQKNQQLDPLEFFNSELKDTGTELLQVYNNVAKGFAIKVPNEKVLEDLKKNPLVDYIGQDKKISALSDSSTDSSMKIQVMPGNGNKK